MISTVYQLVNNMEANYAGKVAIQYYDEAQGGVVSIRYGQYAQDIRRAAGLLLHRDPDIRGKKVCLLARNSYDFLVNMFSVLLTGAVLVPLNLQKNWDEIQYELDLVEPVYILHDGEFAGREPALTAAYGDKLLPVDGYKTSQWSDACAECADRDALSVILFTSGTTGRSKGVMISHRNLFAPMDFYCLPFEDIKKQTGWDTSKFRSFLGAAHVPCGGPDQLHLLGHHGQHHQPVQRPEIFLPRPGRHGQRSHGGGAGAAADHPPGCGARPPGPPGQPESADLRRGLDGRRDHVQSDPGGLFHLPDVRPDRNGGRRRLEQLQDLADIHSVGLRDPKREYKLDNGELCIRATRS